MVVIILALASRLIGMAVDSVSDGLDTGLDATYLTGRARVAVRILILAAIDMPMSRAKTGFNDELAA